MLLTKAAGPAIIQALLLISSIFLFTWYLGGVFGLDAKLRALLSAAISICGVSAAIAAAGAVRARREQLAYTAGLVIAFALPSIFLLPWLADVLGLSAPVAGAWIGGNIDTAAVANLVVGLGLALLLFSSFTIWSRWGSPWRAPPAFTPTGGSRGNPGAARP